MRLRLRAERGFAALGERLGVGFNVLIQEVEGNHHTRMLDATVSHEPASPGERDAFDLQLFRPVGVHSCHAPAAREGWQALL